MEDRRGGDHGYARWVTWILLENLPRAWRIAIFLALGAAAGTGAAVARISRAVSYLSDEPSTCMNCHVMTDAHATWERGSHGRVAVCVDCHVPHTNPVAAYAFKGQDGMRHSYVFTFRLEPQVLRLNEAARPVVQENCLRCHADLFQMVRLASQSERACWDCHDNAHGAVQSLSASPETLRPRLPDAGWSWLK